MIPLTATTAIFMDRYVTELAKNAVISSQFSKIPLGLVESRMCMIIWPLDRFGSIRKPKIPLERYGPTYRHAMADIEREQARNARVTVPNDYGSG